MLIPLLLSSMLGAAQPVTPAERVEVSAGADVLLSVSPYAGATDRIVHAAVHGPIAGSLKWGAGVWLGLGPARPAAFARLLVAPTFGIWEPAAGLELGVAARDDLGDGDKLLRELRASSVADISPFYVAVHTMPLSFRPWERFRFSVLELQVGTPLTPFGRIVRFQVGLVALGVTL